VQTVWTRSLFNDLEAYVEVLAESAAPNSIASTCEDHRRLLASVACRTRGMAARSERNNKSVSWSEEKKRACHGRPDRFAMELCVETQPQSYGMSWIARTMRHDIVGWPLPAGGSPTSSLTSTASIMEQIAHTEAHGAGQTFFVVLSSSSII
jgi:hypothetical protein